MSVINVTQADLSRIAPHRLDDNWIVGVGFLEGYVFLRTLIHEDVELLYDPTQEITATNLQGIAAKTFIAAQKFGSTSLNVPDMLAVTDAFHMYQFYWGVSPGPTRVFTTLGATQENNLDTGNVGTSNDFRFGYINGYRSPLYSPDPSTESFSTYGISYLYGVFNPLTRQISPLWRFYIRRFIIGVITDPSLVSRILGGQPVNPGNQPARLRAIGGLNPPAYNMGSQWKVRPIQLNATPTGIQNALKPE